MGIPIDVSSHSPYFVQGLRYFASAKGIEKDVKYYTAIESEETGFVKFKETTHDLNSVFLISRRATGNVEILTKNSPPSNQKFDDTIKKLGG